MLLCPFTKKTTGSVFPGALTICMENQEIPRRIQVYPSGNFPEKKYYLSRYYLFPVLTKTTEIFCTIGLHYQRQASCREKVKNVPVVCKWYNSIPLLFSVPKKYQYHLMEIFPRNFRTNGKRSRFLSRHFPPCFHHVL